MAYMSNTITEFVPRYLSVAPIGQQYSLSVSELPHLAGEIAVLTDVSIESVRQTMERFGRVEVLFVTPRRQPDPPILRIPGYAHSLQKYYSLWRDLYQGRFVWRVKRRFQKAIQHFLNNSDGLSDGERAFVLSHFAILYNDRGLF